MRLKVGQKIQVKMFSKLRNFDELQRSYESKSNFETTKLAVGEIVKLNHDSFELFVNNFMKDSEICRKHNRKWKQDRVLVVTNGYETVAVDTQGYDYCRYVGILNY
jgi:hypothetical protein